MRRARGIAARAGFVLALGAIVACSDGAAGPDAGLDAVGDSPDAGEIDASGQNDLQSLARGPSGRIYRLKITGEKDYIIVGKELEIRRALSRSHLYSSAFVVDKQDGRFVLRGAGWGHGVGLCQIGAAVMADQGKSYTEILVHYYRGAEISRL